MSFSETTKDVNLSPFSSICLSVHSYTHQVTMYLLSTCCVLSLRYWKYSHRWDVVSSPLYMLVFLSVSALCFLISLVLFPFLSEAKSIELGPSIYLAKDFYCSVKCCKSLSIARQICIYDPFTKKKIHLGKRDSKLAIEEGSKANTSLQ